MTISRGPRPERRSLIGKHLPYRGWCGSTTRTSATRLSSVVVSSNVRRGKPCVSRRRRQVSAFNLSHGFRNLFLHSPRWDYPCFSITLWRPRDYDRSLQLPPPFGSRSVAAVVSATTGRDDAALERSGGGHDIGGLDRAGGGFGVEAGAVGLAMQRGHGDAAAVGAAMWAA